MEKKELDDLRVSDTGFEIYVTGTDLVTRMEDQFPEKIKKLSKKQVTQIANSLINKLEGDCYACIDKKLSDALDAEQNRIKTR